MMRICALYPFVVMRRKIVTNSKRKCTISYQISIILPINCIFITKYLQISEISFNFAADYNKFINFIKTREIMVKRIAMIMGGGNSQLWSCLRSNIRYW